MVLASVVPLALNVALSVAGALLTWRLMPYLSGLLLAAGISGKDLNKPAKPLLAEAMGLLPAAIYLHILFVFLPVPFVFISSPSAPVSPKLTEWISASLSVCCMILLGFADDVLNLRWKHKLVLPFFAAIPLLSVYYAEGGLTHVVMPSPVKHLFGLHLIDLGALYYLYMWLVVIFCTNSINILAGTNGLEVGQSIVIAASILGHNAWQVWTTPYVGVRHSHLLSAFLMLPFLAVCLPLYAANRYPARVFVGDTFCYFAGMTFAVAGILGHFSKTLLLCFVPQIVNFVYSVPQLFGLIPCPRHRLPRLNEKTGLLEMSIVQVILPPNKLHPVRLFVTVAESLGLLFVERDIKRLHAHQIQPIDAAKAQKPIQQGETVYINNLTLLNLVLYWSGPLQEGVLTRRLLWIGVLANVSAFAVRSQLARVFYPV